MILTILYEDHASAEPNQFGLHNLLLRCICDELDETNLWELGKRIKGNPKKGDSGVIRALKTDGRRLLNSGGLLALLDDDKIRIKFGMNDVRCKKLVADKLRDMAPGSDVVLLVENTESLLKACVELTGGAWSGEKPGPAERDAIFNKFAHGYTPGLRKQLRDKVRSFDRLVTLAEAWYQMHHQHE